MERNRTVYGAGVLRSELADVKEAVVVTDPAPWNLHHTRFENLQARPVIPGTLEQSTLDELFEELPPDAQIIGLGGGSVIDAAKYFAHKRQVVPILVPTITSSNAPFSDFISVRRGARPVGMKGREGVRRIVVDYELIRPADKRLNRAGYGDLLSLQTTLQDWRLAAKRGSSVPMDTLLEQQVMQMMELAREAAAEIGSVSDRGIEVLMQLFEKSTNTMMAHLDKPVSAGSEHLIAWNLEGVTGRHFLHGEIVALGVVISSHLHEPHARELMDALDEAQVRFRLHQLGLTWEELRETLLTVRAYNEQVRGFRTVLDDVEWTPRLQEEIHELVC